MSTAVKAWALKKLVTWCSRKAPLDQILLPKNASLDVVFRVMATLTLPFLKKIERCESNVLSRFRTAVSFPGQLGTKYLEFEWFAPKTGPEFYCGGGTIVNRTKYCY